MRLHPPPAHHHRTNVSVQSTTNFRGGTTPEMDTSSGTSHGDAWMGGRLNLRTETMAGSLFARTTNQSLVADLI